MRKVTIYSNKTRVTQSIDTDVRTWGELKPLVNSDMGISGARCMIKENRMTLESNSAVLPDGDFIVYVYPTKVKSGATKKEDSYTSLTDAKLRKACKKKSISQLGDSISLRRRLRAFDRRNNIKSTDVDAPTTGRAGARPVTKKVTVKNEPVNIEILAADSEVAIKPKSEPLVANNEVNIRSVVSVMRNKFLNMFDELLGDIDSGAIKKDVAVLEEDAKNLAQEMGIKID
jgi:hypothetical protein